MNHFDGNRISHTPGVQNLVHKDSAPTAPLALPPSPDLSEAEMEMAAAGSLTGHRYR